MSAARGCRTKLCPSPLRRAPFLASVPPNRPEHLRSTPSARRHGNADVKAKRGSGSRNSPRRRPRQLTSKIQHLHGRWYFLSRILWNCNSTLTRRCEVTLNCQSLITKLSIYFLNLSVGWMMHENTITTVNEKYF